MPEETINIGCRACGGRLSLRDVNNTGGPIYVDYNGHIHCRACYDRTYSSCNDCGAELTFNEARQSGGDDCFDYCECCFNDRRSTCGHCDQLIESGRIRTGPNNHDICQDCSDNHVVSCVDCSRLNYFDGERPTTYVCSRCEGRTDWENTGFYTDTPTYSEIKSERKFGIEIETSACNDHPTIRRDTVFGAKTDGSVDGKEFVSPVLYGDEGLAEVRKLCGHARRLGWQINSACGLHIHLDLSNESQGNCFKLAWAYHHTYDFWTSFISDSRKRNYYCARHSYGPADLVGYDDHSDFYEWCCNQFGGERYNWVNFQAFTRFKTVEIRHHAASLNPTKLCNWIKAHTRFIDNIVNMSVGEINNKLGGRSVYDQMNVIAGMWDDDDLTDHYKERAALFGKPFVSRTRVGVS